jgi:osmotically-inducible protein OsmY
MNPMSSDVTTAAAVNHLETLIEQHLLGRVSLRGFRILVQGRGLILQGCVPTFYAKQLAQHAAMEISGLQIVANEIEVQ